MKYAQILGLLTGLACLGASSAFAAPVLLTISETENNETVAWWPNQPGIDKVLQDTFEMQGVSLVHPNEMQNAPRLSPTVYGMKKLSNDNARTMASLFGASCVLNGNIEWNCYSAVDKVECEVKSTLTLLYGKTRQIDLSQTIKSAAQNVDMAKKFAMTQIVTNTVLPIISHTRVSDDTIPSLLNKPVIIFDPVPDADTLVALRKQLKRVPGVEDVAERWVSNGVLAIEINPAVSEMSQTDFLLIVQGFMNENTENLVIRQTRQTDKAAIFEVVRF